MVLLELVNTLVVILVDWFSVAIAVVGVRDAMVIFGPATVSYFSVGMDQMTL